MRKWWIDLVSFRFRLFTGRLRDDACGFIRNWRNRCQRSFWQGSKAEVIFDRAWQSRTFRWKSLKREIYSANSAENLLDVLWMNPCRKSHLRLHLCNCQTNIISSSVAATLKCRFWCIFVIIACIINIITWFSMFIPHVVIHSNKLRSIGRLVSLVLSRALQRIFFQTQKSKINRLGPSPSPLSIVSFLVYRGFAVGDQSHPLK